MVMGNLELLKKSLAVVMAGFALWATPNVATEDVGTAERPLAQAWVARYNGPADSHDYAHALAVDPDGNVYVTGQSAQVGIDLDYGTIKYDGDGNQLWVARYNGPGDVIDGAHALALDGQGNAYVAGLCCYGVGGGGDFATIKYDPEGRQLWSYRYNGVANAYDEARALAVDGQGNVYVSGWSEGVGTSSDYATVKYSPVEVQARFPILLKPQR